MLDTAEVTCYLGRMDQATNYLGRCKDCDYALFATAADVREADNAEAGGPAVRIPNGSVMGRCTNKHRWFGLKRVQGTYSDVHKCDSRCLNARGHDCTCSCGGANHGRGHAVVVSQVTEREDRVTVNPSNVVTVGAVEHKHLGEVGQSMRGQVRVTGVLPLNEGKTLYTFETVNGGHKLKWFIGAEYNPHWEQGATLTVRFRVKAHDEFRGTPETIITYVEEIES